jgi:signal transduction histidine kinase
VQRRLTIALVGIALATILLVGAGVLVLAQVGARASAEAEVEQRLEAVANLLEQTRPLAQLRPLGGTRNAFGLTDLDFVVVNAAGDVRRLRLDLTPGRRASATVVEPALVTLSPSELDRYLDGQTVIVDQASLGGGRVAVGVRGLDVDTSVITSEVSVGLIAQQGVVTVGGRARTWFVVSALVVLVGSVAAASLLARRLTRPIKDIEAATASIAAGDFDVRVEVDDGDEVGDLARSVNRMAADLQRSKALDQQFLLSVSHDLRTPLTAIAGYAEALSDGTASDAPHAGEIIRGHADRLERLVGDLLDLARLDANQFALDVQSLDLVVATGRVVAGVSPEAGHHGLTIEFQRAPDTTVDVMADPHRVAQVVGNVVDNAIKFAQRRITVRVGAQGSWGVVEISDDGPGIAPEDLPYVFDRLYTASSQPVRAENPTGMGLAIARDLMTAMGGSVTAGAASGGGTSMVLRFPLAGTPAPPVRPALPDAVEGRATFG